MLLKRSSDANDVYPAFEINQFSSSSPQQRQRLIVRDQPLIAAVQRGFDHMGVLHIHLKQCRPPARE